MELRFWLSKAARFRSMLRAVLVVPPGDLPAISIAFSIVFLGILIPPLCSAQVAPLCAESSPATPELTALEGYGAHWLREVAEQRALEACELDRVAALQENQAEVKRVKEYCELLAEAEICSAPRVWGKGIQPRACAIALCEGWPDRIAAEKGQPAVCRHETDPHFGANSCSEEEWSEMEWFRCKAWGVTSWTVVSCTLLARPIRFVSPDGEREQ